LAHYATTFVSQTPVEQAFEYLSRFSTAVEWDPGVVASSDLTPDPVGVGSAFEIVSSILGRRVPLRYEIIEFDAPRLVCLRAQNSTVRSVDTITFVASPQGATTVTYDAQLTPVGLARVLTPLFGFALRRIGDRAAEGLRAAVDNLGGSAPSTTPDTDEAR
jgi:dehydrogenase/reductase SDR family protein 12